MDCRCAVCRVAWDNDKGSVPNLKNSRGLSPCRKNSRGLSPPIFLSQLTAGPRQLFPMSGSTAKRLLVTGSSGLIGSEVCLYFAARGWLVHGVDNNQRAVFFGPQGDTRWNQQRLQRELSDFHHHELDIRDRAGVGALLHAVRPTLIVHTAAQPSHDRAAAIPFDDFDTNAVGTLNMLEAVRQACPESPFVHMSTNKVYGDRPNTIQLAELETRWDYADPAYAHGIAEEFSIDQSKHSLFGASKVAADIMVQEYGRYFGMPTCCLRGGCLTGPNHTGVELHGFLSYLVKCNLEGRQYRVFGYRGKQVRDNIHSLDVARFIEAFADAPRCGEVYNIGGGKANSCSILEAFASVAALTGKPMNYVYEDQNRIGDHICYYSDLRKMRAHYPQWDITVSLQDCIAQIVAAWQARMSDTAAHS
jgi:CDP-paratose 2-epimerase